MKIFINGVEESQVYPGTTVAEVLEQVVLEKVFGGTFISALKLDDVMVEVDSDATRKTPVAGVKTLDIEISSLSGLVTRNIDNAEEYLKKLIPGIQKASELFHSGSEQEANKFFLNIVDGIEWFSQVIDAVLNVIGDNSVALCFNNKTIMDRKSQLLDLISQLLTANKNRDWVLLADLLEYEILPYYQEWESILPALKQAGLEKIN